MTTMSDLLTEIEGRKIGKKILRTHRHLYWPVETNAKLNALSDKLGVSGTEILVTIIDQLAAEQLEGDAAA